MQGYFKEEMTSVERIWHTSFVVSKDISPKLTFISATKTQKNKKIWYYQRSNSRFLASIKMQDTLFIRMMYALWFMKNEIALVWGHKRSR